MRKSFRVALAALLTCAVAATAAVSVFAEDPTGAPAPDAPKRERFTPEAVALFAKLPVQDGGRVKPFSTFANFTLLALNGKQSRIVTPTGEELSATEWLMDVVFFPDVAIHYDCFLLQASEALDAIGVAHESKARRDRYSYAALEPAREKLFELATQYAHVDAKERDRVQGQIVHLAENVRLFEFAASTIARAADGPDAHESKIAEKLFGAEGRATLGSVLARMDELRAIVSADQGAHGKDFADDPFLPWISSCAQSHAGIAMIPPSGSESEWYVAGAVADAVISRREPMSAEIAALSDLERMYVSRGDAEAFAAAAGSFRDRVVARAQERGEYGKIPLEVTFYKLDFFYRALYAFGFAFIAIAISWMRPSKWLTRSAVVCIGAGLLLVVAGITMRCVIRGRPPVSTLYETILFIAAVAVIVALAAEYMNRKGIALPMAALLGAGGMFLANRYEVVERTDTMPSLVAVLDTNFWLATHVTCVTIGYGAGLLAGAVGHLYVLGKVLGLKKGDPGFYRSLTSMTYGMLCFGLVFSVVGTILGGIWANDSWGRFWGWDPKENGALVIVLWELVILHARMAGRIRDFGIAMASVFGAAVVAASWWGVNLLGVGLHSYGFTSGILATLIGYYLFEALVLAAGGIWWWVAGSAKPPAAASG